MNNDTEDRARKSVEHSWREVRQNSPGKSREQKEFCKENREIKQQDAKDEFNQIISMTIDSGRKTRKKLKSRIKCRA